ncbi:hypothetical protein BSR29_00310 [Boudabousia liubingyangii]|uniref:Uncharacterized protein n=1 Tax=Boudabousia liubingyangii TaxID=1921764 RepID=A0A1Q5PPI6_9ACTO|nr:LacI family DNA-binding transcriptional regulator [Boudabousia liubingyangii]OKL48517.1 hypothetical protein BSR28_02170 [Boudabousia liubingyangii]OKL49447.1 hypothetical protein BSR29_00310 [Boudabousia liubingyangii]
MDKNGKSSSRNSDGQLTITDVAKLAGVSPTTVSRVLNNRGYISLRTKEAVHDAMTQLGYRPNAQARALRIKQTNLIGVLFPTLSDPYYAELASQLEERLAAAGLRMLLCTTQKNYDREKYYLDLLASSRVDGIITCSHSDAIYEYQNSARAIITIQHPVTIPDIPNITCNNVDAGKQAARALLAGGVKEALVIHSSFSAKNPRHQAFHDVFKEAGIPSHCEEIDFDATPDEQRNRIEMIMESPIYRQVDSVFATNDTYASMVTSWAISNGKNVPEDLQVIGYDGAPASRNLIPALTTLVQPYNEIASNAVFALIAIMNDTPAPSQAIPRVTFHPGNTIRAKDYYL